MCAGVFSRWLNLGFSGKKHSPSFLKNGEEKHLCSHEKTLEKCVCLRWCKAEFFSLPQRLSPLYVPLFSPKITVTLSSQDRSVLPTLCSRLSFCTLYFQYVEPTAHFDFFCCDFHPQHANSRNERGFKCCGLFSQSLWDFACTSIFEPDFLSINCETQGIVHKGTSTLCPLLVVVVRLHTSAGHLKRFLMPYKWAAECFFFYYA